MNSKRFNRLFMLLFICADYLAVLASFVVAYVIRREADVATSLDLVEVPVLNFAFRDFIRIAPWISLIWILIFALTNQYARIEKRRGIDELYAILQGSSLGVLALMILAFFQGQNLFSRLIIIYAWGGSIVLLYMARSSLHGIQNYLWKKGIGTRRVLICRLGTMGRQFLEGIRQQGWPGYQIIGIIDGQKPDCPPPAPLPPSSDTIPCPIITHDPKLIAGFPYLGSFETSERMLDPAITDEVVVGLGGLAEGSTVHLVELCRKKKIGTSFIPDFLGLSASYKVTETINGIPLLGPKPTPLRGINALAKRTFDLGCSLIGSLILSPVLLGIAIGVKLSSPGPVIYSQLRIGQNGRKFRCYKFRSMHRSSGSRSETGWTVEHDQRRTGFGKIIRKTNLDELPQLLNILRGDMSLIGPRPEQPAFVERFQKAIPRYGERHAVKPGLTGWAQVNGWRGNTSIAERVQYDLFYIENWSPLFDVKIILHTLASFFHPKGAY